MKFKHAIYACLIMAAIGLTFLGCKVSYSFSGASIPENAETFSVTYFPNNAQMVSPTLSATLTEALVDRLSNQTKLSQANEGEGDLQFEGEITYYESTYSAVTGDEYATKNRLTMRVRVTFTNRIWPQYNFNQSFTAYADYDSSVLLQDAEGSLIPELVETIVNDIFNKALSNW